MAEVIRLYQPYTQELGEDEEIKVIDPSNISFVFGMGEGECHMKATGSCSLESRRPPSGRDGLGEAAYDFCPRLLKSMRKHGLHNVMLIDIIKCRCGHYEFNDGQHRTCIAKH
jgi:hypothetical protein